MARDSVRGSAPCSCAALGITVLSIAFFVLAIQLYDKDKRETADLVHLLTTHQAIQHNFILRFDDQAATVSVAASMFALPVLQSPGSSGAHLVFYYRVRPAHNSIHKFSEVEGKPEGFLGLEAPQQQALVYGL